MWMVLEPVDTPRTQNTTSTLPVESASARPALSTWVNWIFFPIRRPISARIAVLKPATVPSGAT